MSLARRHTYDRAQQIYNELVEGTRKEELAVDRANVHQADQNWQYVRIPAYIHGTARPL